MFYVYILHSTAHLRFYIGQTENPEQRLMLHNTGKVKSTKPYMPYEMLLLLPKSTRSEALVWERKLKNRNTEDLKKFILKYRNNAV